MKVGIIQESHTANIDSNIAKLTSKIEELAKKGAQLIVLSELHNSLYFCQVEDVDNFDLAETIPGRPFLSSGKTSWRGDRDLSL